jgi:hypothetical protein
MRILGQLRIVDFWLLIQKSSPAIKNQKSTIGNQQLPF